MHCVQCVKFDTNTALRANPSYWQTYAMLHCLLTPVRVGFHLPAYWGLISPRQPKPDSRLPASLSNRV